MTAFVHIFAGAALTVLLVTPNGVHGQAQCAQAAQAMMKTCAESASISNSNYLWFVTNGTSSNGKAPADEAAFKPQICNAEPQVGGCIFSQLGTLANSTACAQSPQVLQSVQTLLFTYDLKCADPCRFTLIDELRQCYVSTGLDAGLFLSNRTAGQVIGGTEAEVMDFCSKKDALLSCMNPIHDSCSEALPILSSRDFHLPSYEKGVNILCMHPQVYLNGLECFAEPTPQVENCVQKGQQAFIQATVEAQSKNWTQEQFLTATCKVTIDQVDCDVMAWSKKNHEACNKATVGLRKEMECNLMPPNCTSLQKPLFDKACHVNNFNKADRDNFDKNNPGKPIGGNGNASSRVLSFLSSSVLFTVFAFMIPAISRVSV